MASKRESGRGTLKVWPDLTRFTIHTFRARSPPTRTRTRFPARDDVPTTRYASFSSRTEQFSALSHSKVLDRTIFGPEIVSGNSVSSIGEVRTASALLNAVLIGLRDHAHRVRLGEHCLEPVSVERFYPLWTAQSASAQLRASIPLTPFALRVLLPGRY